MFFITYAVFLIFRSQITAGEGGGGGGEGGGAELNKSFG